MVFCFSLSFFTAVVVVAATVVPNPGEDFLLGFRVGAGLSAAAPLTLLTNARSSPALAFVSQAEAYARAGRLTDAAAAYERALSGAWALGDDGGAAIGLALGAVYASSADVPRAEHALRAAAGAARDRGLVAAAHGALGSLFARCGRFSDAERELRVALTLKPGWFIATHDLGSVLVIRGDVEGGVALWEDALEAARAGGVAFEARAEAERRERVRVASRELRPNELERALVEHVLAVFQEPRAEKRGETTPSTRSPQEQEQQPHQTGGAASVETRAASLWALLEELTSIDLGSFHAALGFALLNAGALSEARAHLHRGAALGPERTAGPLVLSAALALPLVYENTNAIWAARAGIVRNVRDALEDRMRAAAPALLPDLYSLMFQLPYAGLPAHRVAADIAEWLGTADEPALSVFDAALDTVYGGSGGGGGQHWKIVKNSTGPPPTVRIMFVTFQAFDCAAGVALLNITRALRAAAASVTLPYRFHITLARLTRVGDAVTRSLRESAHVTLDLYSAGNSFVTMKGLDLISVRAMIAKSRPDVLVYTDPGMNAPVYALLFARLAPVQIALWGADTGALAPIGLPVTIDYSVGPDLATPQDAATLIGEQLARVGTFDSLGGVGTLVKPVVGAAAAAAAQYGVLAAAHLYLVIALPLSVLHPSFDATLCGILRADSAADVMLLVEEGQDLSLAVLRARLAAPTACGPHHARRIRIISEPGLIIGAPPSPARTALLALADVVLDTFPVGGGRAINDALAAGSPVVTLPSLQSTRASAGAILGAVGGIPYDLLVARDVPHYIELATHIASGQGVVEKGMKFFREELQEKVKNIVSRETQHGESVMNEWVVFLGRVGRPWASAREAIVKEKARTKTKRRRRTTTTASKVAQGGV